MKKHTKVYMDFFDYGIDDFIPCEVCGSKAVDVHHIEGRGKNKDVIENLVGLCRECHNTAHSSVEFNNMLKLYRIKSLKENSFPMIHEQT